ncbi:HIT family protein [Catellatospora chokoriensis]|uniref:HIT family protein n=1 Tax=Catellatospora chokoriensis TaxID=310353 RepID=A0A8J3K601_9ACTN|nr:HIT family protein [Catellatospora chokoriensis]GIF93766.1 HIT family protein [Catellatospora chokoriensis]
MDTRDRDNDCPFDAEAIRSSEFAGTDHFAAIYNVAPIVPGHSLVVPREHLTSLLDLDPSRQAGFFGFARHVTRFLLAEFSATGFDWIIQDGQDAGQTVCHLHLHVIPRWKGDLPEPGDWYTRLRLPLGETGNGPVDSRARTRLSEEKLQTVVTTLAGRIRAWAS